MMTRVLCCHAVYYIYRSRTTAITTHLENNTHQIVRNVSTLGCSGRSWADNENVVAATLKRTNSVSVKNREFQSIFDKTAAADICITSSDVNSNICTGIYFIVIKYVFFYLIFYNIFYDKCIKLYIKKKLIT